VKARWDALERRDRALGVGALLLAAIVVPLALPPYGLTIMVLAVVASILAIGLNILMGYTGLDSLGQAAFYGTSAYVLGLLTGEQEMGWALAAALALVAGTAMAAAFGLLAVRLRGLYFLLITLALGQVLWGVVLRWGDVTGGQNGLGGVSIPFEFLEESLYFYYFALAVLIVVGVLVYRLIGSPFGLELQGIRERETRMKMLGHRTTLVMYVAFVIAGLLAALAGVMGATYNSFVSPRDISLELSFEAMLMVILGGAGTFFGPILGAAIVTALQYLLSIYVEEYWLIIVGAVYIVTMTYLPDGLLGYVRELRLGKLRAARDAETAREPEPDGPPEREPDQDGSAQVDREAPTEAPHPGRLAADAAPVSRSDASGSSPALALDEVRQAYGSAEVLTGVSTSVANGERVGIIGPNGAGKTTLFNIISGLQAPSGGRVFAFGRDITTLPSPARLNQGVSRTFQVTSLFSSLTVIDNMRLALLGSEYKQHRFTFTRPVRSLAGVNERAGELLADVGLGGHEEVQVRYLSYGHQRQLELGLALACRPRLLLLDEPTAGCSQADIDRMVSLLRSLPGTVTLLMVEHNLDVVFACVDRLVVLHEGGIVADGSVSMVRADERVKEIYFGTTGEVAAASQGPPE
jgi:branched-chain amino acid transport system ATP-binding protein